MESSNYFLLNRERNVIVHKATGLRINVFGLEVENYRPNPTELHVFGDDHGEWLAFETEGWSTEDRVILIDAVKWYSQFLDYPEINITEEDPRPAFF
jgi:hypothetical protein